MIEGLGLLENNRSLRVFAFLIREYVNTLQNKKYSVTELKKRLEMDNNSLYKDYARFERMGDFFRVEENTRPRSKGGFLVQINLDNELIKSLIALEFFEQNGLSVQAIDMLLRENVQDEQSES